jgi:hypothetical protein
MIDSFYVYVLIHIHDDGFFVCLCAIHNMMI